MHKVKQSLANRDKQFHLIEAEVIEFMEQGHPVIFTKDNIGNLNINDNGKSYRKLAGKGVDQDFPISELSMVPPYGVYVVNDNSAFVNLGTNHDTEQFVTQSCMVWWDVIGKQNFPNSGKILITCSGGVSKVSMNELWNFSLACLAELGHLEIHVSHFPPGIFKWNKVKHRMFCYSCKNMEGEQLIDIHSVVELISATRSNKKLEVQRKVDERYYETGKQFDSNQFGQIDIESKSQLGEWNYIIRGFRKK